MTWIVVLIETDQKDVKTFGPYGDADAGEAARRRVHFEAHRKLPVWQRFASRVPRTYARPLQAETELS